MCLKNSRRLQVINGNRKQKRFIERNWKGVVVVVVVVVLLQLSKEICLNLCVLFLLIVDRKFVF